MLLILVSIVGFFALYGLALLTALQARRFSSAQAPRPSTTPLSPGESRRLISIVLLTPGGIVLLVWYFVGLTQYEIGTISLTAHGVQTFFSQLDQTQVRQGVLASIAYVWRWFIQLSYPNLPSAIIGGVLTMLSKSVIRKRKMSRVQRVAE